MLLERLQSFNFIDSEFALNLFEVFIAAAIILMISRWIIRLITKYILDEKRQYNLRKLINYISIALIILITFAVFEKKVGSISVMLGMIGLGIALASRDAIASFIGWFFIIGKNGFRLGDRIQIGDIAGDVIDIGVFRTTLMEIGNWVSGDQSTGRLVVFPNSNIFVHPVVNFTQGYEFIWNELKFLLTFKSNWKKAEEIIMRHANNSCKDIQLKAKQQLKKMKEKYMLKSGTLTPIVYVVMADKGVELTLRYLTPVRERRVTADALSREILNDFTQEDDINFIT